MKLFDDFFVQPSRRRQRLHQHLAGTVGFGEPRAEPFRDRAVHLLLRAAGEEFRDLVDPALVLLPQRPAVIGELVGKRALLEQPPQVDDRENLAPNRQHAQHIVGDVGNLVGSLHAQDLADMLHFESEFLFGDAKGDHLLDFGVGVARFVLGLAASGLGARCHCARGGRLASGSDFAYMGRIQRHDDALPFVEFHHAFEVVRTGAADGRRGRLDLAAQDAGYLLDTVHAQTGFDAVDIDHQHAGAVGLLGPFHAETGAHVDDRQNDAAQIGDAVHVGRRAGYFRHLGKANDLLDRHDVEAKFLVLQQERDQLAFVLHAGGWL